MPHSPLPGDLWRPVASEARAACRNGLHKIKTLHKFDKILIKLIFSLFLFPSFTYYKTEKAVWSALFTGSTFVYKARIRSKENSEKSQQDWIFSPFIFLKYPSQFRTLNQILFLNRFKIFYLFWVYANASYVMNAHLLTTLLIYYGNKLITKQVVNGKSRLKSFICQMPG